jgi:hypothetical protein
MDFVMRLKRTAFLVGVVVTFTVNAQDFSFAKKLHENHLQYKVAGLDIRRIKHDEVIKNIKRVKEAFFLPD